MLLRPMTSESARGYMEAVAFHHNGGLMERLEQLRSPDREGRHLIPLSDPVEGEDAMELEEAAQAQAQHRGEGGEGDEHRGEPGGPAPQQQDEVPQQQQGEADREAGPQQHVQVEGGDPDQARMDGPQLQQQHGREGGEGDPGVRVLEWRQVPQAPGLWLARRENGTLVVECRPRSEASSPALRRP